MSGKLNALFTQGPKNFLQVVPVGVGGNLAGGAKCPAVGKYDFDLSYPTSEDKTKDVVAGLALLKLFDEAYSARTEPLHAYWLPWESGRTTQITLGDEAPYFFTSALAGCRIQLAGNTVCHIAGDTGGRDGSGPGGQAWREKQAKEKLGPDYALSRKLSQDEYGDYGFFAGIRTGKNWSFILQRKETKDGKWVLEKAEEVLGGSFDF